MKRLSAIFAVLACALASVAGAQATTLPDGFEEIKLVTDLTQPMAVDWTPDGRILVVEKPGRLKVLEPGAEPDDWETVLDISSQVNHFEDRGLLGLAVDSDFEHNHYVYLLYTHELRQLNPDSDEPMVSRLLRVALDEDNQVTGQQVLLGSYVSQECPTATNTLDCIPSDGPSHSIGTVRSAPDGTLYVGVGDASEYSGYDQFAFRVYDEKSFAGKILHVDRNGNGLPGHPFCPAEANLSFVCTKLWAKGFRNPYRFALHPDGGLIVGDVGWAAREEIDLIESGGGSYGWPCREGTVPNAPYLEHPNSECGTSGPQIEPDFDFPHPLNEFGVEQGGAVVGGPVYEGDEYPLEYQGSIFYGNYVHSWISRLERGLDDSLTSHEFGTAWYGSISIETAPDNGDLVHVTVGNFGERSGAVVRIAYDPDNTRPTARASADPTSGPDPGLEVQFDGSESSDAQTAAEDLEYSWDFGDGDTSTEVSPTHTYDDCGTYEAVLTVEDEGGKADTDEVEITVCNTPPANLGITAAAVYRGGEAIHLQGSATDAEDGDDPLTFTWDIRVIHGSHTHPMSIFTGDEVTFQAITDHDANSYYQVRMVVKDSGGLVAEKTIAIDPETTEITLASDPPGARIHYGEATVTATLTRSTAIGFTTTVTAEESFSAEGRQYAFESWSNGAGRSQAITVPAAPLTLTARYRRTDEDPEPVPPKGDKPPRRKGPALVLKKVRRDAPRTALLIGRANDPDGVARVQGAVYRKVARGRCRYWSPRLRKLAAPRSCAKPIWITARLSGPKTRSAWRLRTGGKLPAGAYRLRLRAYDRAGTRSVARFAVKR